MGSAPWICLAIRFRPPARPLSTLLCTSRNLALLPNEGTFRGTHGRRLQYDTSVGSHPPSWDAAALASGALLFGFTGVLYQKLQLAWLWDAALPV